MLLDPGRDFALDEAAVLAACTPQVKLVFLCSPNNPTGNAFDAAALARVAAALDGRALLVVDDIFVADRQVVQRQGRPIMLDQFEDPAVVQGCRLQREGAVVTMGQVIRKH